MLAGFLDRVLLNDSYRGGYLVHELIGTSRRNRESFHDRCPGRSMGACRDQQGDERLLLPSMRSIILWQ